MTVTATTRASDRDREAVVRLLREQTALGGLTLAEFEDRMSAALTARTWGDLVALTADLPVESPLPTHGPRGTSQVRPRSRARLTRRRWCSAACLLPLALALLASAAGAPAPVAVVVGLGAAAVLCMAVSRWQRTTHDIRR